jgi:hypothetical protein
MSVLTSLGLFFAGTTPGKQYPVRDGERKVKEKIINDTKIFHLPRRLERRKKQS